MMNRKSVIKSLKVMLGNELRKARESRGLTIEEAAAAAGIEKCGIIYSLEAGKGSKLFFVFRLLGVYEKRLWIILTD